MRIPGSLGGFITRVSSAAHFGRNPVPGEVVREGKNGSSSRPKRGGGWCFGTLRLERRRDVRSAPKWVWVVCCNCFPDWELRCGVRHCEKKHEFDSSAG